MRLAGKYRGTWYSDAQILEIKTRVYDEARRYHRSLLVKVEGLEFQLAEREAEYRRLEEELDALRAELRG